MPFSLDVKFVNRAEEKLGRRLPPSYVAKMCRDNGGDVETETDSWTLYPIFDDSDKKRLKRTREDILNATKSACTWPDFPSNALVIGDNGCGDKLVLLEETGTACFEESVYWWDHETGGLTKVAVSFEDLREA